MGTHFTAAWFPTTRSFATPALPGAAQMACTWDDCASFHTSACSRPPAPITRSFIAAGLNQEIRRFGKQKETLRQFCGGTKTNCAGEDSAVLRAFRPHQRSLRQPTASSLQGAVGFQQLHKILLREHPVLQGQWMVRQLVPIKLQGMLPHHASRDARSNRPRLSHDSARLGLHGGPQFKGHKKISIATALSTALNGKVIHRPNQQARRP
jgi:hypothetical protein